MNKERLVKTFTDLVALDSPSFDEQAVCRYIQERLTALGVQADVDLASGTAVVTGKADDAALRKAVTDAGYEVVDIK